MFARCPVPLVGLGHLGPFVRLLLELCRQLDRCVRLSQTLLVHGRLQRFLLGRLVLLAKRHLDKLFLHSRTRAPQQQPLDDLIPAQVLLASSLASDSAVLHDDRNQRIALALFWTW